MTTSARTFTVLLGPHVSEKSTMAADKHRQIVFKVRPDAKKSEIKTAVETLFKVKVGNVTSINVKGKTKRFKQVEGRRKNWKKAFVTLKEGYDIEFAGAD